MSPLVREIATEEVGNVELRRRAKEVATEIKKLIGNEKYAKLLSRVQQKLDIKKAERKRIRAQQVKLSIFFFVFILFMYKILSGTFYVYNNIIHIKLL